MKAWQVSQKADQSIDTLSLNEVQVPEPQADQVLVRVLEVGLNPVDYKIIEGGVDAWTFPHTVGIDGVGLIERVGDGVTNVAVGDRVFYHGDLRKDGTLAEYALTDARGLAHVPDELSNETAAAILCSAMTAYQALYRKANLTNKQTILVHAGGGNVGVVAIQLAKQLGLTVISTTSKRKQSLVEEAGADFIINYRDEDVTKRVMELTDGKGVDLSLNTVGGAEIKSDLERMAYNGQILVVGDGIPADLDLDQRATSIARLALGGVYRSDNTNEIKDLGRMATELAGMAVNHRLEVPFDQSFGFNEVPAALQAIKNGSALGKLTIKVSE